ncbi:hypothetical protein AVEN_235185-1 [Araneus ventricosus]|uniref:Uncharacterized protein n=1 Tax=Araneus ventricosus TaxID=182803 RepID=A0A4Y2LWT5_ARAVE|nr:hypothetical protein AVEN_235185-1 [Araneus ventricosus]
MSSLQIVCQSVNRPDIDEEFGQVKGVAQFTVGVLPGEDVMVGRHICVQHFYKSCAVQAYAIPCQGSDGKRIPYSLAPTPDGYHGWQIEAEEEDKKY